MPEILTHKEKIALLGFFVLFGASLIWLFLAFYYNNTEIGPALGGKLIEGAVGTPRYANPIFAASDIDRDLTKLVFSGLVKYGKNGELVPDLAERFEISADQKTYVFYLRQNVKWHDGENLTADDVIFTAQAIQNPEYKSPLRPNILGADIEKIDGFTVKFSLKQTYAPFLENLAFGVIPKHVWANIPLQSAALADYNIEPIGSGPYEFSTYAKDKNGVIQSYSLNANEEYFSGEPYISEITFKFYASDDELVKAAEKGEIGGFSQSSTKNLSAIKNLPDFQIKTLKIPRYYAVFFNQQKSKILADLTVRTALDLTAPRQAIIAEVLENRGVEAHSPIHQESFANDPEIKNPVFDEEKAGELLKNAGWKDEDNDGFLEKITVKKISKTKTETEEIPLELEIVTSQSEMLKQTAEILKKHWEKIGIKVNLKIVDNADLQQNYLAGRNYDALLFGEVMSQDPDVFAFWHSSQKKSPGLNIAVYDNKTADKLLEEARQTVDVEKRKKKYREFQALVAKDKPAIFLFNPYYIYVLSSDIKGAETENIALPSLRFADVENWHVRTGRRWK